MVNPYFESIAENYPVAAEAMSEIADNHANMVPVTDRTKDTGDSSLLQHPFSINSALVSYYDASQQLVETRLALFGNDTPASRLRFINHYLALRNKLVDTDTEEKIGDILKSSFYEVAPELLSEKSILLGAFVVYEPVREITAETEPSPDAYSTLVMPRNFLENALHFSRDSLLGVDDDELEELAEDSKDYYQLDEGDKSAGDIAKRFRQIKTMSPESRVYIAGQVMMTMPNKPELDNIINEIPLLGVVAPIR